MAFLYIQATPNGAVIAAHRFSLNWSRRAVPQVAAGDALIFLNISLPQVIMFSFGGRVLFQINSNVGATSDGRWVQAACGRGAVVVARHQENKQTSDT